MAQQNEAAEALTILRSIREGQEEALSMQRQALELQREMAQLTKSQFARAEAIQTRAEQLQDRSAEMIAGARRVLKIVLPIILILVAYLSWLIFRRYC